MPLPFFIDPQTISIHEVHYLLYIRFYLFYFFQNTLNSSLLQAPPIPTKFTYIILGVLDFLTFRDLLAMSNPETRHQGTFLSIGLPNSSQLSSSFPFENQGKKKLRHIRRKEHCYWARLSINQLLQEKFKS
ncbi:conserved hypothetical protein [Ricinus communis]|uniref:Uncharacterized protein n=1 Tax=Ricinus communis TaxID=3988 RepID=B9SRE9_RICCO|nr:conserved hypothetical protein [Ricinus communis]